MPTVKIAHFSDVLCVWAYVSQIRINETKAEFGDDVDIGFRFIQVFGDVAAKLEQQWAGRGGARGYSDHVRQVVSQFEHVEVHDDVWARNAPRSSMPCHLFLCAVRLLEDAGAAPGALERAAWRVRVAFFEELVDVSDSDAQRDIAEQLGLDVDRIERLMKSGEAHALLSSHIKQANEAEAHVSPTLVLDGGRQRLAGNVGYRVIEANVRELLRSPAEEHSWC